jgi:hypothetical protein
MARRGLWVIGGVAVGVGALALAPETRTWLRRRLGMEPEDRQWFEEEGVELPEHEGDEPLDTRESRFSLRARLAEEGHGEPAATAPPEPETPPAPTAFPTAAPPPAAPAFEPPVPAPESEYVSYESVPAVTREVDAPKTPGEDTNEIEPLPPESADEPAVAEPAAEEPAVAEPAAEEPAVAEPAAEEPAAEEPAVAEPAVEEPPAEETAAEEHPPPPPTMLRPPAPPPPSRPFTGEGASFRSAIDAARERVHGAAREATPDEGEGTEPIDERP